ncbi:unnamed protein product [Musa hybrid cultivar]
MLARGFLLFQIFHQFFHMDANGENISKVALLEKPCAYSINHVLAGHTACRPTDRDHKHNLYESDKFLLYLNDFCSLLSPSPT